MPAISGTVSIPVVTSAWAALGQVVFIQNAGYFTVTGIADATHITGTNLGYSGNAAPTTVIASASKVSPGGLKGVDGSAVGLTLNPISPTTTKGDLIVDNGANNPLANDVRMGVGANGTELTADSTQATGMAWKQNQPNAATDKGLPRFNGASGTPIPLQTSKVVITDNGAVQASGSGGNARGTDSVDLQVIRALVTQVASGTRSAIVAGSNNTASATDTVAVGGITNSATGPGSCVVGGQNNIASGNLAAVLGGNANHATGTESSIAAGSGNVASGDFSFVGGGLLNTASGIYSAILAGLNAIADKYGQNSFSAGAFATPGDSQKSELIWRIATSDATAGVEMFLNGVNLRATIPNNVTWGFDIIMVGRSSAGVEAVWSARGAIHNNAGTTALTAAVTPTMISDGTGASWGVAANFQVAADNANSSLKLSVTGAIATNIRYTAHARIIEVGF